jgi:hypothetical protein
MPKQKYSYKVNVRVSKKSISAEDAKIVLGILLNKKSSKRGDYAKQSAVLS